MAFRSRTLKTFSSTTSPPFQKQLLEEEIAAIVAEFQAKGWAAMADNKVAFSSPQA